MASRDSSHDEPVDQASFAGTCPSCDRLLVNGSCSSCGSAIESRFVHREVLGLIVLGLIVLSGFLFTRTVAAANRTLRAQDGAAWYNLARSERAGGRIESAIRALRRAVALDRSNVRYRLELGNALATHGDADAARQVLMDVRAGAPERPDVNIELARLEARGGHLDPAVRYYQSALQGAWGDTEEGARQRLRIELIQYLLSHDRRNRALSELLALSSSVPPTPAALSEVAQLFLVAGDPARALTLFRRALDRDPDNIAAREGAGLSAFAAGDYTAAHRYLQALDAPSPRALETRTIAGFVLSRDPLRPGLSRGERRRRIIAGIATVLDRIDACLVRTMDALRRRELEQLRASTRSLESTDRHVQRQQPADAIEASWRALYRIEQQTAGCGTTTPLDQALLIIGRRHEASQ